MRAKVGHFHEGRFKEITSGSEEYCRGFLDGYNLYSDVCVVILVGNVCQCGRARVEYIKPGDKLQMPRTGCLRCDRWDAPPRFWAWEDKDTTKWYNCPRCDAGYPDQECVCEENEE